MTNTKNPLVWENDDFEIRTPYNPHIPYGEGLHLVVAPKAEMASAWENPELAGQAFKLASQACKIMEEMKLSPWFNLQANGNWGLLPGGTPFFHIHIYGRNKTESWGKPVVLPEAPGTFQNRFMPEMDRNKLSRAFAEKL